MALKDLPKTFVVDFAILLNQSSFYILDKCIAAAGPKPSADSTFVFTTGALSTSLLLNFFNTYISPLNASYRSLGTQAFIEKNNSTFSKTYIDAATWQNEFFILRTQIVGDPNDGPILEALDKIWKEISGISGRWVKIEKSSKDIRKK